MTGARKIRLAHHLKTLKLPTLPHGNMRSLPANVPPKGWIMSGSAPVWERSSCPAASAARSLFAASAARSLFAASAARSLFGASARDRERQMVERRIKAAKFPATRSLGRFDFKAIAKLNKTRSRNWPAANGLAAMQASPTG